MTSNSTQKPNEPVNNNRDLVVSNDIPVSSSTKLSSKVQMKIMSRFCVSVEDDPIIFLNVGGVHMLTRRSTLMRIPDTVLCLACTDQWSERITRDDDGRLFFDFDPNIFQYLLNQLRDWSSMRKVFELPKDEYDRQRFRSLCSQLNFPHDMVDGIYRHEKFIKTFGHIVLDHSNCIAIHAGNYRHGECRGMNAYSTGISRIVLVLKHTSIENYNTFIGIIWYGTPMQEKSIESSTAYGWGGGKHVYLRGRPMEPGYGGYDSDMCTNDKIELILNCQLNLISMFNHRTKKLYQIPVDTNAGCPFPWQLHINLHALDDGVKIINPS